MNYLLNKAYLESPRATGAEGAYIKIDGRWLIDTSMGSGAHILGHGVIAREVCKVLDKGTLYVTANKYADKCGKLLHDTTGFDRFVFANSGAEATMKAMRIARAYTGRDKVAMFVGGWHGCQDYAITNCSLGIPSGVKDLVSILPLTAEAIAEVGRGGYASVIIEPVQSAFPTSRLWFLKNLREACTASDTVLIFDEVITGFRLALGGGKEFFNITPDIATYGKIVGGGFPVGVIAGKRKVMDTIKKGVKMGGTFSANPITSFACYKMLSKLKQYRPYEKIKWFMATLSFIKSDILQVRTVGTMGRLIFTSQPLLSIFDRDKYELSSAVQKSLITKLRKKGVHVGTNRSILLSFAHTEADIECVKTALTSL